LAAAKSPLTVALGGDNSITFAVARGVFGADLSNAGLITLDAHHDLRDGISNGSPVRRLIEAGLNPKRIVQIGIADFSNSPAYAERAHELGIRVIARSELRRRSVEDIWAEAVSIAGAGTAAVHVDFDVDVCDRAVVPGCPAAAPGGISADELRQFAYLAGWSKLVKSIDITEVDATADAADGRTVRLAALVLLEAAAGLASR
jgi:formiminoglutamase